MSPMSDLPSFRVRNLGPIAEGTVDLHPLTILIGKNNTGKTYMAQAVYAAYKALERANGRVEPPVDPGEILSLLARLRHPSGATVDDLFNPLASKLAAWHGSRLEHAGRLLENRLEVYFDVEDIDELARWNAAGPLDVAANTSALGNSSVLFFGLSMRTEAANIPISGWKLSKSHASRLDDILESLQRRDDDAFPREEFVAKRASSILADFVWQQHILPSTGFDGQVHYLPAGRSGLLEAWTDVVRMRLEQDREGFGLSGHEPPALGGIALDFLITLQQLTTQRPRRSRFRRVDRPRARTNNLNRAVSHLEKLIGGSVELTRGRERVPVLSYQQGSKSIPVQRASAMVAELAPLLSWMAHLLRPGDLLLIDEPEAHMHPAAVLAVAETLVAISQAGVRVLCTTHSSEFLHMVSNCMLRATASHPDTPTSGESIDLSDLGVYLFERQNDSGGTVVRSVEIDPEWGIPEDEHVAVADYLAEETERLVGTLD